MKNKPIIVESIILEDPNKKKEQIINPNRIKILWTRYRKQIIVLLIFIAISTFFIVISYIPPFNDVARYYYDLDRVKLPPSPRFPMGTNIAS